MLGHYQAQRYLAAQNVAEARLDRTTGAARAEARWIAGMSAYHLGRDQQAIHHLTVLATNPNTRNLGPVLATLGLIYESRSQYVQGIDYMTQALPELTGQDKAQAYYHLGMMEQNLGHWPRADTYLSLTISHADDTVLRREARHLMSATAFTLQLGAYADRDLAIRRSRDLAAVTRAAQLPQPIIIPSDSAQQQELYLIQTGRFRERASALSARQRLDQPDAFIARLYEPRR